MSEPDTAQVDPGTPFQIGLALAGAISAGAYTAGALDFLFQALSEWEARRGEAEVAKHRVVIKVIAGASAGAITGALGAIALARGLRPEPFEPREIADRYPDRYTTHQRFRCALPSFRQTWVVSPAMVSRDGNGGLLGTDDIRVAARSRPPILRSLLNASLLDSIKRAALDPPDNWNGASAVAFIAQQLHVYLTISNLRGIPFKVAFGRNSYGMQTIGDRIHYVVTELGSCDVSVPGSWAAEDASRAGLNISVKTLPARKGDAPGPWELYGEAALASGAFPLGLAARSLRFAWGNYLERRYPIPVPAGVTIQPSFPASATDCSAFAFESVDGGLVNNHPFDYAQYALFGAAATGPIGGRDVKQAIIMVAPFPEPPAFPPEGSPSQAVTAILRALFPALLNQARFRAADLAPAVDQRDFSRFLIAPVRRIPRVCAPDKANDEVPAERFPIACGLLGGFGGFLEETFRAHDFQLGRRNCQQFLRTGFLAPADNVIVGAPGITGSRPIIPLVGAAADPVPLPLWPQIAEPDFDRVCAQIAKRIDAVMPLLVAAQTANVRLRFALRFGWWLFLRGRVIKFLRLSMLTDLVRRGQIKERDVPPSVTAAHPLWSRTEVQAIIAELINPSFDFRTAGGIATKVHVRNEFVDAVLKALSRPDVPKQTRAWRDGHHYTLFERRPFFLIRLWPLNWLNNWWNAPAID